MSFKFRDVIQSSFFPKAGIMSTFILLLIYSSFTILSFLYQLLDL